MTTDSAAVWINFEWIDFIRGGSFHARRQLRS
jgi:hypothetical protein